MTEKSDMKDQSQDSAKDAKKAFESYYTVAKHKLGREPTFDEVVEMMGENSSRAASQTESVPTVVGSESPEELEKDADPELPQDEEEEAAAAQAPAILRYLLYFGMADRVEGEDGSVTGKPDPNKVLFYEDPQTGSCYDCNQDEWLDERPAALDHLPARKMQFTDTDIIGAIAHGVMDDEGFETLDKAGMITDTPRALWSKTKALQKDLADLEKMEAMEKSEGVDQEGLDPDYRAEGHGEQGTDNVDEILNTAGVARSDFQDLAEVAGDDVAAQFMATAIKIAMTNMEDQIRAIVREELSSSESYDEDEELSTPVGQADLDDEAFVDDEGIETVDTESDF